MWTDWDQGGEAELLFLGRGWERAAFHCNDLVLKFCQDSQKPELQLARALPNLLATVCWEEPVDVRLYRTPSTTAAVYRLHAECQLQCEPAVEWMTRAGETAPFKFLEYTAMHHAAPAKAGPHLG